MSDIIGAGPEADGCERWQVPEVTPLRAAGKAGARPLPTAARIEELQRQAHQEAFEQGRREGLEKGRQQVQNQAARLEAIVRSLARPLEELDERVMEEVGALALAIARHLVRRELRADPGQILAVVQQAAAVLPAGSRRIRLYVNPEDAAVIRGHMTELSEPGGAWQVIEDPALMRGGCRVETEHSRIDASIERRLAAIAADLLGGDRAGDGETAGG
jgi:flagellar assembly protein FliH